MKPPRVTPVLRNAADSAARVGRRKRVSFAPLISIRTVTPYCVVYGMHPREFDFDSVGRMVSRHRSHLAPHVREIKVKDSKTILNRLSADLLLLQASGIQSQEEEFELTTDITRRRKRSETSRDGKDTKRQSLIQIVNDHTSDRAAVTGGTVAARLKLKVPSGIGRRLMCGPRIFGSKTSTSSARPARRAPTHLA